MKTVYEVKQCLGDGLNGDLIYASVQHCEHIRKETSAGVMKRIEQLITRLDTTSNTLKEALLTLTEIAEWHESQGRSCDSKRLLDGVKEMTVAVTGGYSTAFNNQKIEQLERQVRILERRLNKKG